MTRSALIAIWLVAACAAPVPSSHSPTVPTAPALTPPPTSPPTPTSTQPTLTLANSSAAPDVFAGVVELLSDGWSDRVAIDALAGFPSTLGRVYGPDGITIPPDEGPGRIAFYETFPADPTVLESRIEALRRHGGQPKAVIVNGDPAEVWFDKTSGELLLGWTLPGKSEILIANRADFTVAQLVKTAESVADCCG
jgi:hypothetical protein